MSKSTMNKTLVVGFVALMVVALASYGVFVESAKKEKSVITSIGTVGISVTPYPTTSGTDAVAFTYSAPGQYDFTGWTIETGAGDTHVINAEPISEGETMVVCGEDIATLNCADTFDIPNIFDNNQGDVIVSDDDGTSVARFSYSAPTAGQSYSDAPDLRETVFSGNAQVEFCRTDNQGGYTTHQGNVGTIVAGNAHAAPGSGSIIPSFYYDVGSGIGYYAGLNWPDLSGVFANGCS